MVGRHIQYQFGGSLLQLGLVLLNVLLGLVGPGLVLLQFVPPVGHVLAVVNVAGERLGSGVGLGVSPQLAGLHKTLEKLASVILIGNINIYALKP